MNRLGTACRGACALRSLSRTWKATKLNVSCMFVMKIVLWHHANIFAIRSSPAPLNMCYMLWGKRMFKLFTEYCFCFFARKLFYLIGCVRIEYSKYQDGNTNTHRDLDNVVDKPPAFWLRFFCFKITMHDRFKMQQ